MTHLLSALKITVRECQEERMQCKFNIHCLGIMSHVLLYTLLMEIINLTIFFKLTVSHKMFLCSQQTITVIGKEFI